MRIVVRIVFSLTVAFFCSFNLKAQTGVSGDGIMFPDGTIQTTAASATMVLRQRCVHSGVLSADQIKYLTCESGGRGGTWSDINGVPAGQFFVMTGIRISPLTNDISGGIVSLGIDHVAECDNGVPGHLGTSVEYSHFKLAPDLSTYSEHSRTPLALLPEGSCLRVLASQFNTHFVYVYVYGYLTTDPDVVP